MMLGTDAVDRNFNGRVQEFCDHHNQDRTDQQRALHTRFSEPECGRNQYRRKQDFEAERLFVAPDNTETGD